MAQGTGWNAPIIVAILAAFAAGLLNAVVAFVNGKMQRGLEAQKAESDRILETIKTGDLDSARRNLGFLLDAGLVGEETGIRVAAYLRANPNSGPVLPSPNAHYQFGSQMSASQAEFIQNSLDEYTAYLERFGFQQPSTRVTIRAVERVDADGEWISAYNPANDEILLTPKASCDPDLVRREYTHHAMRMSRGDADDFNNAAFYLLESDVADYFVCSYAGRSTFAPGYARANGQPRLLENDTAYSLLGDPRQAWLDNSEIWGGALWAIRKRLGPVAADFIVAKAWTEMPTIEANDDEVASKFIAALATSAQAISSRTILDAEGVSAAIEILSQRGFPGARQDLIEP
ncbi:MAG TPA: hypothetical protein VGG92_12545 [Caulobacteraceae bacterium]